MISGVTRETALGVLVATLLFTACGSGDERTPSPEAAQTETAVMVAPTVTPTPSYGITVLSVEPAPDYVLRYSPDGHAYIGRERISAEGATRLVIGDTAGGSMRPIDPRALHAEWAPDSRTLAVSIAEERIQAPDNRSAPLYFVNADGSSLRHIGSSDFPYTYAFLLDGRLAFVQAGRLAFADPGDDSVQIVDTASPLANLDESMNEMPFRVSPDGRFIAVMQDRSIYIQDLESGETRPVTDSLHATPGYRGVPYAWSPDGRYLVYSDASGRRIPSLRLLDTRNMSSEVLLTATDAGKYTLPAFSPDGAWLFFIFQPTGTAFEELASYEAISLVTGAHQMLYSRGDGLRLSPDGRTIGFARTHTRRPSEPPYWQATVSY
jgi:hypothetical protein